MAAGTGVEEHAAHQYETARSWEALAFALQPVNIGRVAQKAAQCCGALGGRDAGPQGAGVEHGTDASKTRVHTRGEGARGIGQAALR